MLRDVRPKTAAVICTVSACIKVNAFISENRLFRHITKKILARL